MVQLIGAVGRERGVELRLPEQSDERAQEEA
jgi:hypothetical protein